jgi:hypothetical protein
MFVTSGGLSYPPKGGSNHGRKALDQAQAPSDAGFVLVDPPPRQAAIFSLRTRDGKGAEMTAPEQEERDDLELEFETVQDLEPPLEEAEQVKGGVTTPAQWCETGTA